MEQNNRLERFLSGAASGILEGIRNLELANQVEGVLPEDRAAIRDDIDILHQFVEEIQQRAERVRADSGEPQQCDENLVEGSSYDTPEFGQQGLAS